MTQFEENTELIGRLLDHYNSNDVRPYALLATRTHSFPLDRHTQEFVEGYRFEIKLLHKLIGTHLCIVEIALTYNLGDRHIPPVL